MTLAIEVPAYVVMLRAALDVPARAALIAAVGLNLLTHPIAVGLLDPRSSAGLGAMELGVVATEATLLWLWLRRDAWLCAAMSVAANGLSLAAGLL